MPLLPPFLPDETAPAILARILAAIPPDLDTTEGSFIWDLESPVAVEIANAAINTQIAQESVFPQTAQGTYLDLIGEGWAIDRKSRLPSHVTVTFGGTSGTVIPAGTIVSTVAISGTDDIARQFTTDVEAIVGAGLTVDVPCTSDTPADGSGIIVLGSQWNVAAGSIQLLVSSVPGIVSVVNTMAATGGTDTESDLAYRTRILFRMRHPRSTGTLDDYVSLTMDVPGVGIAEASGLEDENGVIPTVGNVSVYIADSNGIPASDILLDQVAMAIAPPHVILIEAESITVVNPNIVQIIDRSDDTGTTVEMLYDPAGPAELAQLDAGVEIQFRGIWSLRPRLAAANTFGANDIFRFGVWNDDQVDWCKTRSGGAIDAFRDLRADELFSGFYTYTQDFYWNGADEISPRFYRLLSDVTGIVLFDNYILRSSFSQLGAGAEIPFDVRVNFKAMGTVQIEVSCQFVITGGGDQPSVRAAITAAIAAYIKSLALGITPRTVVYAEIVSIVSHIPGVYFIQGLTVNSTMANVDIPAFSVPLLTGVIFATWDQFDALHITYDAFDALMLTWSNFSTAVP